MSISEHEKIELTRKNIWQALRDYRAHTYSTDVLDDVTDAFVDRLAEESVKSKSALREMFRKSPVWNEELDALVINGTRTHDTNYYVVARLINEIMLPAYQNLMHEEQRTLEDALSFFTLPEDVPRRDDYIDAIKAIAPNAYKPGKKRSRVFKALCKQLNIVDETAGSEFQRLYALIADELSAKKIDFKLFVSLNPAHFLTMSNPVDDERGKMLVSCHSFNRTDYPFNNGCSGYAIDDVTMIAFTVSNPNDPETLNNRKTSRQLFMYKPGNGLLLQSRMYNTDGGTFGAQTESELYRDLIQREISACEDVPNLWKTHKYVDNKQHIKFEKGLGFGGYPDWQYSDFHAMFSIRNDHADDYETFDIGNCGICIVCGNYNTADLYCVDCDPTCSRCEDCGRAIYPSDDAEFVYDSNGNRHYVCRNCLDNDYYRCNDCGRWFSYDDVIGINDEYCVCDDCLRHNYSFCEECEEYYSNDCVSTAIDANGREITVCDNCLETCYVLCDECNRYVHMDNATHAHHNGSETCVCASCMEAFQECESCGEFYHEDDLNESGICSGCAENDEEVENVDSAGEIHLSNAI